MQVVGKDNTTRPCVATIGTFDGVHRGHQFVAQQVVSQARERGLDAVVLTFSNHPSQVLNQPSTLNCQLSTADEKTALLQKTGIDKVVLMDFTPELAQMSAQEFMRTILKEQLNVQVLLMGYDNHFGHDRTGFEDCQHDGKELGIEIIGCEELMSEQRISSTAIRQALLSGDVDTANTLLGYHYALQGEVVQGFQNGRKLGYPTANLQVNPCKLIPENGAYLVRCNLPALNSQLSIDSVELKVLNSQPFFGMLNVGTRPTLHNGQQRSIEVHLFDFDGDLYGQTITIELLHHLRKEQEFATIEALQQQLATDEEQCRRLLQTSF
ncbi:MAG: bifunctional riboflavin kinase/FAD synthetase [Bacteroidaceae bacterium]|nr:bifunctional riboflavin kinase/FAD synthetase [Bacteroidaceae bacterium]